MWLIRLMVLCSSHSVATGFLGSVMKMDLLRSERISPLSFISFIKSVPFCIPKSHIAFVTSTQISFTPVALLDFIFEVAAFTSLERNLGPSMVLLITDFSHRESLKSSSMNSAQLFPRPMYHLLILCIHLINKIFCLSLL